MLLTGCVQSAAPLASTAHPTSLVHPPPASLTLQVEQQESSSLDLMVAGTADAVLMIEGFCDFLTEDEMLEVGKSVCGGVGNDIAANTFSFFSGTFPFFVLGNFTLIVACFILHPRQAVRPCR